MAAGRRFHAGGVQAGAAASCPDIALLPALAQLFRISLDERFGLPCPAEIVYELVADLPWEDGGKLRFAVYEGRKLLDQSAYELQRARTPSRRGSGAVQHQRLVPAGLRPQRDPVMGKRAGRP